MARPALGRGLGALLGESQPARPPALNVTPEATQAPQTGERVRTVALDQVRPCPFQPRKDFAQETLRELAESIKEQGIVQPLIVRAVEDGLELIAGERRWRAARLAGLTEVPVIVREADDHAVLELALIENLQRENLNPLEEAQGYAQLMDQFRLTQEEIATRVGKSRTAVANALRLLKLAPTVQAYLREGRISVGHAKAILGLNGEKLQRNAADRVIKEELNVRQVEGLVAQLLNRETGGRSRPSTLVVVPPADPHVTRLEDRLRERLGTKVNLRYAQGKGALEIAFFSEDDLDRILQILGIPLD
jgi:ParB family chromosome partitioning protein